MSAPDLPEGWTWTEDGSVAYGPRGKLKQGVWVHSEYNKPPHLEMPLGCTSAPVEVCEAVIRRAREDRSPDRHVFMPDTKTTSRARQMCETNDGRAELAHALGRENLSAMLAILPDATPALHAMSRQDIVHAARHRFGEREAGQCRTNYLDGFQDAVDIVRSWAVAVAEIYEPAREALARLSMIRRLTEPLVIRRPCDAPTSDERTATMDPTQSAPRIPWLDRLADVDDPEPTDG